MSVIEIPVRFYDEHESLQSLDDLFDLVWHATMAAEENERGSWDPEGKTVFVTESEYRALLADDHVAVRSIAEELRATGRCFGVEIVSIGCG